MSNVKNALGSIDSLGYTIDRFLERIDAPLSAVDKAAMAADEQTKYKCLEEVDPTFMSSSKQFSDFKRAYKRLVEKAKNLDPNDYERVKAYTDQVKETTRLGVIYLRYKRHQLDGPEGAKHKRSDTERKRVQTVDNLVNGLKQLADPGTLKKIIDANDTTYKVYNQGASSRLLEEYTIPKNENPFDKYMRTYTGRGAMNADKEVLAEYLSNAVGAYFMKKKNPEAALDEKKLKQYIDAVKEQFLPDTLSADFMRHALADPKNLSNVVDDMNLNVYGIDMARYNDYLKDMRLLYQNMKEPPANSKGFYSKLYETVKKAAHLPENTSDIDPEELKKKIADLNHEMCTYSKNIINNNKKTIGTGTSYSLASLNIIGGYCEKTKPYVKKVGIMINKARGLKEKAPGEFDILSEKYVNVDAYTAQSIENHKNRKQNGQDIRKLDEELLRTTLSDLRHDKIDKDNIKNVRKNMEKDAEKIKKAGKKPSEAPVQEGRGAPASRPRRNSIG